MNGNSSHVHADPLERMLQFGERIGSTLIVISAVTFAIGLPRLLGLSLYDVQLLVVCLCLALAVGFFALARRRKPLIAISHVIAASTVVVVGAIVAVNYVEITMEAPFLPSWLVALSVVICCALVLNLRPAAGMGIFAVVIAFFAYGLFGHLAPGDFRSREIPLSELLVYLAFDPNGILGAALKVAVTIVIPYLFFGRLLSTCGAADFFNELALAGMGRYRGGPAKVAVAASALFGSISGSAVGNVVGTGVVTIPMMKRTGFRSSYSGAVEAVASTGGQLVPPVMGAAAFIMADTIGVDYVNVMLAAIPSALLYYLAIFVNVDLQAARAGIRKLDVTTLPRAWPTLRSGWHFVLPFVVLFFTLFELKMRPEKAAVIAAAVLVLSALVFGYKGNRPQIRELLQAVREAGRASLDLIIVCAGAGVVIGVLSLTGFAFSLTMNILQAAGGNIVLLIVITAIISVVLGMGMPTVGVYILLATLVAPALVESGIPVMAAHLFVFYFGLLSMITPPVALASFAAANIANSPAWTTSLEAMKLGWPAYIVPFLFVFAPSLVLEGTVLQVTWALLTAVLGIYMVTAGIVGVLRTELTPLPRVFLVGGGISSLLPAGLFERAYWTDIVGVAVFLVLLIFGISQTSRKSRADL